MFDTKFHGKIRPFLRSNLFFYSHPCIPDNILSFLAVVWGRPIQFLCLFSSRIVIIFALSAFFHFPSLSLLKKHPFATNFSMSNFSFIYKFEWQRNSCHFVTRLDIWQYYLTFRTFEIEVIFLVGVFFKVFKYLLHLHSTIFFLFTA